MRVIVLGQGYIGLPLAIELVGSGHEVLAVETDTTRYASLQRGYSYLEDISSERIRSAMESGKYRVFNEIPPDDDVDAYIIAVPTPLRSGKPDTSAIERAAEAIAGHIRPGRLVVLESTSYPGTTETIVGVTILRRTGLVPGEDFHLAFSSERVDPGNPYWGIRNTPKVVAGINPVSAKVAVELYRSVVDTVVEGKDIRSAELAKLYESAFRFVGCALVNELVMQAAGSGVDVRHALELAASKPFGYLAFEPGPGVGGHCLPVDTQYLSWWIEQQGSGSFSILETATKVDDRTRFIIANLARKILAEAGVEPSRARVVVLGVAYKRNVADCRETPAAAIVERLESFGCAVTLWDPVVGKDPALRLEELAYTHLQAFDLAVLLTDHDTFDYEKIVAYSPRVLDTRGRLQGWGPTVTVL